MLMNRIINSPYSYGFIHNQHEPVTNDPCTRSGLCRVLLRTDIRYPLQAIMAVQKSARDPLVAK
jgi:hypothetical protein